jgi:hypothetical protein
MIAPMQTTRPAGARGIHNKDETFTARMKHMTFQSGQSGNPAGRPKGARGKAAILAEQMFEGEAKDIIRAAIDLAKAGDPSAVRVCLDRIAPRPKDRVIAFELSPLHSAADAASALAAITAAVTAGELTPSEAGELFKLVDGFARMLEARTFEDRVARLEHAVSSLAPASSHGYQSSLDNAVCQPRRHDPVAEP